MKAVAEKTLAANATPKTPQAKEAEAKTDADAKKTVADKEKADLDAAKKKADSEAAAKKTEEAKKTELDA